MRPTSRIVLVTVFLLTSCSGGPDHDSAEPLPDPTRSERYEEIEGGSYRVWPTSTQVDEGIYYRFELLTHCGIENTPIDFDGSMWVYEGEPLTRGPSGDLEDPGDRGVIRLVDEDEAEFTSEHGTVVSLKRHQGPVVVPGCA